MRKPDFFIVGAPKCGTTALYEYLKQHPEVFMPKRTKEPNFFGADFNIPFFIRNEAEYLSLFAPANHEKRAGEATVWYLYSKLAAREIKEFSPTARIVIMLRDPVEMIHALHSQLLFNGDEDIEDFETALAAEEDRKKGLCLPRHPQIVETVFYREVGKFTEQVQRYFDVFDRAQIKIIIYDDLRADTAQVYRETCAFLDVDQGFEPNLRVVNANKKARSGTLREFSRVPPSIAPAWAKTLVPLPVRKEVMLRVANAVRRINTKHEPRSPMSLELRKSLQAEFAQEVQSLSKLLGRDLTHWSR